MMRRGGEAVDTVGLRALGGLGRRARRLSHYNEREPVPVCEASELDAVDLHPAHAGRELGPDQEQGRCRDGLRPNIDAAAYESPTARRRWSSK
jgi:hypothetical protein